MVFDTGRLIRNYHMFDVRKAEIFRNVTKRSRCWVCSLEYPTQRKVREVRFARHMARIESKGHLQKGLLINPEYAD
jgi:hypothetical protein